MTSLVDRCLVLARRWMPWLHVSGRSGHVAEPMRSVEPIRIAALSRQVPGQWVALRGEEVIEARSTLDQLMYALADRCIAYDDVLVMRAPAESESELVGIG